MNFSTIYTAGPPSGIPFGYIFLFFFSLITSIFLIKIWKYQHLPVHIFTVFWIMMLCIAITSTAYMWNDARVSVYEQYKKGNYNIVTGIINSYGKVLNQRNDNVDNFIVGNVHFNVPGETTSWGYPFTQQNGGVLKNGLFVRITYIHYKYENVIMKLEVSNTSS